MIENKQAQLNNNRNVKTIQLPFGRQLKLSFWFDVFSAWQNVAFALLMLVDADSIGTVILPLFLNSSFSFVCSFARSLAMFRCYFKFMHLIN